MGLKKELISCIQKGLLLTLFLLISACGVRSKPATVNERYAQAQNNLKTLFAPQQHIAHKTKKIDFYEALGLGLKYNLDYRIKLANNALQLGQLKLAEFAMFPALNVSGSLYTRNNDLSSFGTTTTGQITDVLNSTPRTLRSARVALSWNVLDFGLSYVRAKQQSEKLLIAQEESRKQLQKLTQDIITAYLDAYGAQKLVVQTRLFQSELVRAKQLLELAIRDQGIPKENILSYQEALLEGNRHLIQLQFKYDKAMFDLKHLLSIPLSTKLVLADPPPGLIKVQDLSDINFEKLDAITLVSRPELRGQDYQKRIACLGIKAAILQALPGITLNEGWNYNSNKFLINNQWVDKSIDVAWNLLNLAALPTSLKSAESQVEYEKIKLMALTLTVLTETRYAYSHYQNLMQEYHVAQQQTQNAMAMQRLTLNRQRASLASSQQVMLARIRALAAKMDQNLLLSDLTVAYGELYLSAGFDMMPLDANNLPLPVVVQMIRSRLESEKTMDFKLFVDHHYARLFHPRIMLAQK